MTPLFSVSNADFIWPDKAEVVQIQDKHENLMPSKCHRHGDLWCNSKGPVWVPDEAEAEGLELRTCIIGHRSSAGHRAAKSTEQSISSNYFWSTMKQDISNFVKKCIHCTSTACGDRVPCTFGPTTPGTKSNDFLQFDFLEMTKSNTGPKYLLMLRDDFLFGEPNAANSATAILEWCSTFNPPLGLMLDGGFHFKKWDLATCCPWTQNSTPLHVTLYTMVEWGRGAIVKRNTLDVQGGVIGAQNVSHWVAVLSTCSTVRAN